MRKVNYGIVFPERNQRCQMGNGLSHKNSCNIEFCDQERLIAALGDYNILICPCVPFYVPELKIFLKSSHFELSGRNSDKCDNSTEKTIQKCSQTN
jgi:hypothetical protein